MKFEISKWKGTTKIYYGLLMVILLSMVVMSLSFGITGDEVDMNFVGKATLDFLLSMGQDKTIFNLPDHIDRDHVLKYYGAFFDLLCNLINKISFLEEYTTRHILNAIFGFLAIFFASRVLTKYFGYGSAIVNIIMMFTFPFFLGNAMNNPKDIPFATLYIISVYYIVQFVEEFDNNCKWLSYFKVIIPISLAINIRVAGILLILYIPVMIFLKLLITNKLNSSVKYIKPFMIIAVLSYLGASVLWPFSLQNPIMNPLEALQKLSNFQVALYQLYEGKKILSSSFSRYFLIEAIYLTAPPLFLFSILLAPIAIIKNKKKVNFHIFLFLAFSSLFPIAYIVFKKANTYHLWRHILFIFPPISATLSILWFYLTESLESKKKRIMVYTLIGMLSLQPIIFYVNTYPQFVSYFNPLVGGMEKNYGKYEVDFNYNSFKESIDWFIQNELPNNNSDTIIFATNHFLIANQYFKPYPRVKVYYLRFRARDNLDYDYALFHCALVDPFFYSNGFWLSKSTIYTSNYKNCVFNVLYKRADKNDYLGKRALDSQNFPKAIDLLTKALQYDPNNEIAWTNLGFAQLNLNQPDAAIQSLSNALKLSPENIGAQNYLAYAYLQSGNLSYAQSILMNMLEKNPNLPDPYRLLGQIYMQQGNTQMAEQYNNAYQQIMAQLQGR